MKSRHSLNGEITKLRRGLAIYKTFASPYYFVRMRNPKTKKYSVKSSKEISKIRARETAEDLYLDFLNVGVAKATAKNFAFNTFAERFLEQAKILSTNGTRSPLYFRDAHLTLNTEKSGLLKFFGDYDVREITSGTFNQFTAAVTSRAPTMSRSYLNKIASTFKNVMNVALSDGKISSIPTTKLPMTRKSVPRPFFRFYPLVEKKHDQYALVCKTIKSLADENAAVRGVLITLEFLDLVQFLTNSFLRPTTTELYALRHADVSVEKHGSQNTLRLNVRKGKTGARISVTMEACVGIYERMKKRYPNYSAEDFIFYPKYLNRKSVTSFTARLLNHVLDFCNLNVDPYTQQKHVAYSFRHTAIIMRLVNSEGKINIFTLAKNCGTSVEMIENFYAKSLPITGTLIKNLQSFGE